MYDICRHTPAMKMLHEMVSFLFYIMFTLSAL